MEDTKKYHEFLEVAYLSLYSKRINDSLKIQEFNLKDKGQVTIFNAFILRNGLSTLNELDIYVKGNFIKRLMINKRFDVKVKKLYKNDKGISLKNIKNKIEKINNAINIYEDIYNEFYKGV